MNTKELCQFLVTAKKQTYAAGDKAKKTVEKDKSTTITFEQGDWTYHDNYFGGAWITRLVNWNLHFFIFYLILRGGVLNLIAKKGGKNG